MGYSKDDNFQSLNSLQVPKSIEAFIDELPSRYLNGEINPKVEEQIDQDWSKFNNNLKKKRRLINQNFIRIPLVVAASVILFVGVSFVSPAVAQVASTIPYLSLLFEHKIDAKPLLSEINDTLYNQKHYKNSIIVSVNKGEKQITVMVIDTKDYFNQVKKPVEKLINNILTARKINNYKIEMLNDPETARIWEQSRIEDLKTIEEETRQYHEIKDLVTLVLQDFGYKEVSVDIRDKERIEISGFPNTENRIEEMKNKVMEKFAQEHIGPYSIKMETYNPQLRDRAGRWFPIVNTMAEGLVAKEKYMVESVGFSNTKSKEYFHISVNTILSSSDSKTEVVVNEIIQTIQDFINSADIKDRIKDDKYEIIIYSSQHKELRVLKN